MKVGLPSRCRLGHVAMTGIYTFAFVLALIDDTYSSESTKSIVLDVKNGGTLAIRRSQLQLTRNPGEICKVQVVENEPMYQKVGEFTPKVFDCDFPQLSVRYQHNGSPLLSEDKVKLRVNRLMNTQTIQETLYIRIRILNSECEVIKTGSRELIVSSMNGVSNPIRKDVVHFNYDRLFRTNCELRIASQKFGFPEVGQLVVSKPVTKGVREYEPVDQSMTWDCDEFLLKEVRYQHLIPPTPDVDYIPLHVVIKDKRSRYILKQEYRWLPVRIRGAFPNQNPTPSFSNRNILEVDQFVTTNLLSTTMSATDSETKSDHIVFNVTKPPDQGFLVHLNDESKPIESFYQKDIADLKVAYQPPNVSYSERQSFFAEFVAYDSRFAKSVVIQIMLSVRVSHTRAPRISWNMGLTMLEGQSRKIDKDCLQVAYTGSLDTIRMTLSGGLQHGKLLVDGQPGYSFSWSDIENKEVMYQHDDSDTIRDFVMFQVSDFLHRTRFKLPIDILPKDDSPPTLVNNVLIEVAEGQIIHLYAFMLEAFDEDSSSDLVKFNITKPPKAGQIQKKKRNERSGWKVSQFEQKDINQGNIIYRHSGDEAFEDSFEFMLMDTASPYPNISPAHTVRIRITPVDDQPPKAAPDIERSLTVNETDVAVITSDMLSYIDEEDPGSPLKYVLTSDVKFVESQSAILQNETDAGHLFHTDDMVMLMKSPGIPNLKMFSQDAIDHNKVAYMPPMSDIARDPLSVYFEYSVIDIHGTKLDKEKFFITLLPVDNQAPTLRVSDFTLKEGHSIVLSEQDIEISDADTSLSDVMLLVTQVPKYGQLQFYGNAMAVGDSFGYGDLEDFSIQYMHDGYENFLDSFELVATDGHHNSTSAVASIVIKPIDDEDPRFTESSDLIVNESNSVTISNHHLSATDIDTDDEALIFHVISPPSHGTVLLNGHATDTFTQRDIREGNVEYRHNRDEIGYQKMHDVISLMVTDKQIDYDLEDDLRYEDDERDTFETLDLNVTVLPVDNRPPEIILGSAVFYCDEGGRHEITPEHMFAIDLDTPTEKLVLKVSTPQYGYLEDQTPREGYEKQISVPVNTFSLEKISDGMIFYVQSKHQGIEPTVDTFTVQVTDGKHVTEEVPFLIAIKPVNDEAPRVQASNFSCDEGGMHPLSESVLQIVDLDVPENEVMVSVLEPPTHGMLFDEMEMKKHGRSAKRNIHSYPMHEMHHVKEFSMHDRSRHMVKPAYMHDGTENARDSFRLKISDGKHTYMADMGVNIYLVNDEKPVIAANKGITVELGDNAVLNSVVLYSTDGDSSNEELIYIIHSIPNHGKLQKKGLADDGNWTNLQIGDSFTERNIADNKIRYLHTDVFSSRSRDSFRFSVTDGAWTTRRENFEITIQHEEKGAIHVVMGTVEVKERDKAYITTEVLSARDGFDRPEDISYEVVSPPVFGQLEHVVNPFHSITVFSQLDLMARKIVYRHKSKEDSLTDSFVVEAGNGIRSREAAVMIEILPVDIIRPAVVLFPNMESDLSVLKLFRGASITINEMTISVNDPDTSEDNVNLVITSFPEHGLLTLDHETLSSDGNRNISLTQLQTSQLMYEHNGDSSEIDRFSFIVTDNANQGFLLNGVVTDTPVLFNIGIENLDSTPPILQLNIPTKSIEPFGSRDYGVYIDSHNLMAMDEGADHTEGILFTVTEPPSYGTLKKKVENGRVVAISDFTVEDLKTRKLVYTINGKLNVTSDSFVFDLQDDWGNVRMGNRFSLSWARVEFEIEALTLCENETAPAINIRRYGSLQSSSFVSAKVVSLHSAEENRDFTVTSGHQIQFDPGSSQKGWVFNVENDGLRERKEKFKVLLHSPVNTVLEPRRKDCTIIILDAGSDQCGGQIELSTRLRQRSRSSGQKNSRNGKRKKNKSSSAKKRKGLGKSDKSPKDDADLFTSYRTTRKYGKLGKPIRVRPSTYSNNGTHKVWRYHGIIPITIDEETVEKTAPAFEGKGELSAWNTDKELINDEAPKDKEDRNVKLSSKPKLVMRDRVTSQPTHIPCTRYMFDRLLYDDNTATLMRCNGADWVPWSPSKLQATEATRQPTCEDDWYIFQDKCFYIHSPTEEGESWNSAQRKCRENFDAHLATITSKKHMNWLRRKARRQKLWIGLNRKITTDWEWAGGDTVTFTNWKRNFSRAKKRARTALKCAMVTERKRWTAKNCEKSVPLSGFVCMKQVNSEV